MIMGRQTREDNLWLCPICNRKLLISLSDLKLLKEKKQFRRVDRMKINAVKQYLSKRPSQRTSDETSRIYSLFPVHRSHTTVAASCGHCFHERCYNEFCFQIKVVGRRTQCPRCHEAITLLSAVTLKLREVDCGIYFRKPIILIKSFKKWKTTYKKRRKVAVALYKKSAWYHRVYSSQIREYRDFSRCVVANMNQILLEFQGLTWRGMGRKEKLKIQIAKMCDANTKAAAVFLYRLEKDKRLPKHLITYFKRMRNNPWHLKEFQAFIANLYRKCPPTSSPFNILQFQDNVIKILADGFGIKISLDEESEMEITSGDTHNRNDELLQQCEIYDERKILLRNGQGDLMTSRKELILLISRRYELEQMQIRELVQALEKRSNRISNSVEVEYDTESSSLFQTSSGDSRTSTPIHVFSFHRNEIPQNILISDDESAGDEFHISITPSTSSSSFLTQICQTEDEFEKTSSETEEEEEPIIQIHPKPNNLSPRLNRKNPAIDISRHLHTNSKKIHPPTTTPLLGVFPRKPQQNRQRLKEVVTFSQYKTHKNEVNPKERIDNQLSIIPKPNFKIWPEGIDESKFQLIPDHATFFICPPEQLSSHQNISTPPSLFSSRSKSCPSTFLHLPKILNAKTKTLTCSSARIPYIHQNPCKNERLLRLMSPSTTLMSLEGVLKVSTHRMSIPKYWIQRIPPPPPLSADVIL